MDKSVIKNFAVWARRSLIAQVAARAEDYGIRPDGTESDLPAGRRFSSYEIRERKKILLQLEQRSFDELVEEIAYTWFNRFAALYYMEVNGCFEDGVQLFTDGDGQFSVRILDNAGLDRMQGADARKTARFRAEGDCDGWYRYLLACRCNLLKSVLPEIFQPDSGYMQLLCPTGLLESGSVPEVMVNRIDRKDWENNIEIISRLYQFYNTEPKDAAFASLKKDQKLTRERIPEATQMFTPEWISGYMVENTLGRLWMEKTADTGFKEGLSYYMDAVEEGSSAAKTGFAPEQIRLIDPCMGSGHILIYAFDVLMQIYARAGIGTKAAVRSILTKNLYGLDIDERACQLASFSIMMKACAYDKSILTEGIRPAFYTVTDSSFMDDDLLDFAAGGNAAFLEQLDLLRTAFQDASEFGSIIRLPDLDLAPLIAHVAALDVDFYEDIFSMLRYQTVQNRLLPFLHQAQILKGSYHVVVTNPPYMALSNMDTRLSDFVRREYKDSKKDMYAVFIEKCAALLAEDGYMALITQHSWMFINSYRNLRKKLYDHFRFLHMVHLGTGAFEEISGEVVQTVTWVMRHRQASEYAKETSEEALFVKLDDVSGPKQKEQAFLENKTPSGQKVYRARISDFQKIPGMPVAYWTGKEFAEVYTRLPLESYAHVTNGLFTCDNKRFLKYWYEVDYSKINFDCASKEDCIHSGALWFPYNKGGGYRRWYGNQEYVVYFPDFGAEIADFRQFRGQSRSFPGAQFYFRPSISWSLVSPSAFSVRYYPKGFVFDIAGSSVFVKQEAELMPMLGILASDTIHTMMKISNPTINFQCGDVRALPFEPSLLQDAALIRLAEENVALAKADWDSFETSWNFRRHPLAEGPSLRESFAAWQRETKRRFERMQENETKVSQIVAKGYGLPENKEPYPAEAVTMYRADAKEEAKSFLSWAAGCMLGRYSVDCDGLACGGGRFDPGKYRRFLPEQKVLLDGPAPGDMFARLLQLLRLLYGEASLQDNLLFLAEGAGKEPPEDPAQAENILRRYFRSQFLKDHNKRYRNAPVYYAETDAAGDRYLRYIHQRS